MTNSETLVREAINAYCVPGLRFRMKELTDWVTAKLDGYCAPDTPGRILRRMRTSGSINVRVVDRQGSLYEVVR